MVLENGKQNFIVLSKSSTTIPIEKLSDVLDPSIINIKKYEYSELDEMQEGDILEANAIYDSGLDPLPPFYGLSNLNNHQGFVSYCCFLLLL